MAADGLFETMRVYNGCVFALDAHLQRMISACPVVGIRPPEEGLLRLAVRSIITEKNLKDARLRLRLLNTGRCAQIVITAQKLAGLKKASKGLAVLFVGTKRMQAGILTGVKTLNRRFYEGIFKKAKGLGYDEGIFLNTHGEVVEGTRTNIFMIKDKEVSTPRLSSGCLPGVTRRIVMALLAGMKIPCREKRILPGELFGADGMFLTNSIIGAAPVVRLNKNTIGDGYSQYLIKRIISAYKKEVEKKCGLG
ncbi:MAG TPA: hypothetical protein DCL35_01385 [Candidatus Omnitrophica bacterium]|nr:hypothetical protein [Candidatus Omnitrophota bacterium]